MDSVITGLQILAGAAFLALAFELTFRFDRYMRRREMELEREHQKKMLEYKRKRYAERGYTLPEDAS